MGSVLSYLLEPIPAIGWPESIIPTGSSEIADLIFHIVVLSASIIILITFWSIYGVNVHIPSPPTIKDAQRQSFTDSSFNPTDLMINYQVATATYGGVYTETGSNYIGSVSPDAVEDQIKGGARSIIFDVWPNPTDTTQPCIAIMEQNQGWWITSGGLNQGVSAGGYSNWKMLTRNSQDLLPMLQVIPNSAFSQQFGQSSDPFFVTLNLHGAMTVSYLTTVGTILEKAFSGHHMPAEYAKNGAAGLLCTSPVSAFQNGRIFVIANIVIDPAFQSLPSYTSLADVNSIALSTPKFAEQVNLLSGSPPTVFPITNVGAITTTKVNQCLLAAGPVTQVSLPKTTFCVVQPIVGVVGTDNATLFKNASYDSCRQTGAQFVGVNMFDNSFLNSSIFASQSFQPVGN